MFPGLFALVGRSLRVEARSWEPHLTRLGLMAAIYASLCETLWNPSIRGAPGLRFIYGIACLNLAFLTLVGISSFATSVTEDKETDALGLLLLAGVSPLSFLVGKLSGRLIQTLLLVTIQYPLALLSVTMSGVAPNQVGAVYIALAAYTILLAGLGLICSTIASSSRAAASFMIVGLALYILVPLMAAEYLAHWISNNLGTASIRSSFWLTLPERTTRSSVFSQLGAIVTTGHGESHLSLQVISNSMAGVVCFVVAWSLFGVCTRNLALEAASSRRVGLGRGRGWRRGFSPRRAWNNPFVWKDFHFVSDGVNGIIVRLALWAGLWVGVLYLDDANFPGSRDWHRVISLYQFLMWLVVTVDAARVLAQSLQDEIRGQTLGTLVLTPHSTHHIVDSKFAGALLGMIPGFLINLLLLVLTPEGRRNLQFLGTQGMWWLFVAVTLLLPHVSGALAVFVRWTAVPIALIVVYAMIVFLSLVMGPNQHGGSEVFCVGFVCVVCLVCRGIVFERLRALAEVL